jgi:hypothetical protein
MLKADGTMKDLIDEAEKNPYETVFLIGNGVVENGWEPFREAIDSFVGEPVKISPIDVSAYVVFQTRLYSKPGTRKELFDVEAKRLSSLKAEICKSFASAQQQNRISLKESKDYASELANGRSIVVTTNWDTLLVEKYTNTGRYSVVSLHGNVRAPTGIYLPTETTLEPYWKEHDEAYRHLHAVHRLAVSLLDGASRIVVWGSSLDSYDAEVSVILAACAKGKAGREYFVIDPRTEPVERLKFLTGAKKVKHIRPARPWLLKLLNSLLSCYRSNL